MSRCTVCGGPRYEAPPTEETRTVIRRDGGMAVVRGDDQVIEVPAWAVEAIARRAGRVPSLTQEDQP